MSDLIFAVFSGVPGTAELRWHGPDFEEAQRIAIENSRAEPLVSIRVLPPDWPWKTTVFRWEHLPGEHVVRVMPREYAPEELKELQSEAVALLVAAIECAGDAQK